MSQYNPPNLFKKTFNSVMGQLIWSIVNRQYVISLFKLASDQDRPAAEAIGVILLQEVGNGVKDDLVKKATGNMIKHVMEENGYKHKKYNVPCSKNQGVFSTASIYKKVK